MTPTAAQSAPRLIRRKKIVFRVLVLSVMGVVGAGLLEGMLRIAGFRFKLYPDKIEFGFPDPQTVDLWLKKDRDLFWVTPEYGETLARAARDHPALVFMGCSCTQYSVYPAVFERRVRALGPDDPLVFPNFGTIGWTSYQGMRQLKRDVLPLKPKVVTIFYGWNDHWFGFGVPDRKMARLNDSILTRFDKSRVVQFITMLWVWIARRPVEERPLRVPPEEFESNLRAMIILARANGIKPVLLTAPDGFEEGLEPAYLLERHLAQIEDLIPLHARYAGIVRRVAESEGVPLCDLAAEFDRMAESEYIHRYFKADGLHLSDAGGEKAASLLYETFKSEGLLPLITAEGVGDRKE